MSEAMAPVPKDSPLMQAWEKYKASEAFANTRRWMITGVTTGDAEMILGQFWGAFMAAFNAAQPKPASEDQEAELIRRMTAAMREADEHFARVGGSTRHHVRDCLIPVLPNHGLDLRLSGSARGEHG